MNAGVVKVAPCTASRSESETATTGRHGRLVADPEAPDAADADADGWSRDGREELLVDVDVR